MKINTELKLRDTFSKRAKFRKGDMAYLNRTFADDSKKIKSYIGQIGRVLGYRDYYATRRHSGPGNRYYVPVSYTHLTLPTNREV